MSIEQGIRIGLFIIALTVAAVFDMKWRRVPNWLTVGFLGAGVFMSLVLQGPKAAGLSVLGSVIGLSVLLIPFARGWVGGGDAKLLGSIGAWLGPEGVVYGSLFGAVAGGVLSGIYFIVSDSFRREEMLTNLKLAIYLRAIPDLPERPHRFSPPYAVALSIGALCAFLYCNSQTVLFLGGK